MYLKYLLKAVCLLLLLSSTSVYSGNVYAPNDEESIVIIPVEQSFNHRPHSKAFVPFEANYNAGLASVLVRFINLNFSLSCTQKSQISENKPQKYCTCQYL